MNLHVEKTLAAKHSALQAVDIDFTDDYLQQRLLANNLSNKHFKYGFDCKKKPTLNAEQAGLAQFYTVLHTYLLPETKNWHFKTVKSLIAAGNLAAQQQTPLNDLLQAIQTIELKGFFNKSYTQKYHLFLTQLLFESLHITQSTQLEHLLYHDATTGLPKTPLLIARIKALEAENTAEMSLFSIKFLLERNTAKFIETEHSAISSEIVTVLKRTGFQHSDIYQSSQLQFELLLNETLNQSQFQLLAAKIQRSFEHVLTIDHQGVLITPKIGVATLTNGMTAEDLLQNSRLALDYVVDTHDYFELYSDSHHIQLAEKKKVETEVIAAFNNEDLELYFQPIVSLPTEACVGAEVLLRWPNATTKGLYPSQMIEILNRVGMGKLLTRWLVNSVCRMLRDLHTVHEVPVYLTFNLRAEDLNDLELPHLIMQSAQLWEISPEYLVLEITEEGILVYNDTTAIVIAQLVESGFKLALDDFGTGYSSLARLKTMPISLVKIDQTFIRHIHESPDDFKIVGSMAQLATSLGKEVLVEGIETAEALALINQLNIPKAQGYYFAKPMPFEHYIAWAKPRLAKH